MKSGGGSATGPGPLCREPTLRGTEEGRLRVGSSQPFVELGQAGFREDQRISVPRDGRNMQRVLERCWNGVKVNIFV